MFVCNGAEIFDKCKMSQSRKAKKISHFLFNYCDVIGKGKFSSVFLGKDTRTNSQVAIKVINFEKYSKPNLLNLLYQQAQIFPQLNHPNVVKLYSRLVSQNNCYLVMELCREKNLEIRLKESKKLENYECQRIILDIYKGLAYLNEKGVIHRDLKTGNILFSQNGTAKISDFGFAIRSYSQIQDIFVGTPYYMSPESMLYQKYSQKSDVWSFGIIVYEMYHGYVPMRNCLTNQDVKNTITKPVVISQKLEWDVREFLQKCLQLNSLNRWSIQQARSSHFISRLFKRYHIQTSLFNFSTNIVSNESNARSSFFSSYEQPSYISTTSKADEQKKYQSHVIVHNKNQLNYSEFIGLNLQYIEIVALIHYCRLINRIIDLQGIVYEDLAIWLLKIIYYLNSDTLFYDPMRPSTESVLKGYRSKYCVKYSGVIKQGKDTNISKVLVVCTNLLRGRNVTTQKNVVKLLNILLRQTKLIKECLQTRNFNKMGSFSQSQKVLNQMK